MDVVVYARISDDRTGEEAGVTRQLDDIRALATRNGDRIVAEQVDNDESAYRRRTPRPAFTRVVEMIKAGEVGGIYCWHPDRLYRSPRDLEDLVDLVDAHNLIVRTVKAGDIDLSTATGRMTARVVGSMARYESEHKADRQARKHAELAKAGKRSGGGKRPFGFQDDRVSIEPTEAAVLRTAAESILAGGSLSQAARDASAALGRTVRPNVLRAILTRAQIAGYREHIPAADRRRGVTTGTVTPAAWPGIIDEHTWRRLREILLDPSRRHTRPARAYLLSGLLVCGLCDTGMVGGNGAYKCSISSGGCGKTSVAMGAVDEHVITWARSRVATRAVARQLAKLRDAVPATGDVLGADQIDARRSTLAAMFADGQISPDEWRDARDRLDVHATRAKVDTAERTRLAEAARRAVDVLAAWDESTVAERRAALSALLAGRRLVVEPRGKRNGNRFDPDRIKIVKAEGGSS